MTDIFENTTPVGDNVQAKEIDGKLILIIDLSAKGKPSSSGKMMGIANTGGFTSLAAILPGLQRPALNLYFGTKIF